MYQCTMYKSKNKVVSNKVTSAMHIQLCLSVTRWIGHEVMMALLNFSSALEFRTNLANYRWIALPPRWW